MGIDNAKMDRLIEKADEYDALITERDGLLVEVEDLRGLSSTHEPIDFLSLRMELSRGSGIPAMARTFKGHCDEMEKVRAKLDRVVGYLITIGNDQPATACEDCFFDHPENHNGHACEYHAALKGCDV